MEKLYKLGDWLAMATIMKISVCEERENKEKREKRKEVCWIIITRRWFRSTAPRRGGGAVAQLMLLEMYVIITLPCPVPAGSN